MLYYGTTEFVSQIDNEPLVNESNYYHKQIGSPWAVITVIQTLFKILGSWIYNG